MKFRFHAFLLLGIALAGCSLAGDITPPPSLATAQMAQPVSTPIPVQVEPPAQPPNPLSGAVVYAEKCAPCHGIEGSGEGEMAADLDVPPAALADPELARQSSPRDWYEVVTVGRIARFMPGFQSLIDKERWDVVAYALSLSTTEDELSRAADQFAVECAGCHGPDGSGQGDSPDLTRPDYYAATTRQQIFDLIMEGSGEMPGFADQISPERTWWLAAYVQSLSFETSPESEGEELAAQPSRTPVEESEAPASSPPEAAELGTIQGEVTNATPNGSVPEGLEVRLEGYDGESLAVERTLQVGQDGSFQFSELEIVSGRLYLVGTTYQEVGFRSEAVHLLPEDPVVELPLTIYETTARSDVLRVSRLHLLFDFPGENTVRVLELWVMSNPTDRVVAGGEGEPVLEVPLPEAASNLRFEEGSLEDRFVLTPSGFADTAPVGPGQGSRQLVFSFELPYDRGLDFSQDMPYPVDSVILLMPEGSPSVRTPGFQDLGVQDMGGIRMENYRGSSIPREGKLEVRLAGRFASPSSTGDLTGIQIGGSVLLAVLAGTGWWWFTGRHRSSTAAGARPAVRESTAPPARSVQDWVEAIARLDDRFERGEISEKEHRALREEWTRNAMEAARREHD